MKGQGAGYRDWKPLSGKTWALVHKSPTLYGLSMWGVTRFRFLIPKNLGPWTSVRTAPKPAVMTLHERVKAKQVQNARG